MSIIDQIIQVESGGNPNAKNPRSSATGAGQFIDSTWLNILPRYRPDLTTGRTREEILALRNDPDISRAMTEALASENAAMLTRAGFNASPGNTYLAHFVGPNGAVGVLKADSATPVANLLDPKAINANPFLLNMTAGDLQNWANNKMNNGPQSLSAATQQNNLPVAPSDQSALNLSLAGATANANPQTPPAMFPMLPQSEQQNPQTNPNAMMQYFAQLNAPQNQSPTLEPPSLQRRRSGPYQFPAALRGGFSF